MSEPNTNPAGQEPTPGEGGEITFTQAEVDALVSKEKARAVAKATKGMPNEEELTAFRTWKESQQTEREKMETLTKERDTAKTELASALAELEQFKREKYLTSQGVQASDVDYFAYKIGKLVTEDKPFEKAAEEFLKENTPSKVRVDMTARLDGSKQSATANDTMNALIRGALH